MKTLDPHILIEEQRPGYTRYRRDDGRRWEVWGVCDHNRACMVGAVVDGVLIESVEQARALPTPELDCPVGPGFKGCCDLRIVELDPQTPVRGSSAPFGGFREFAPMFFRLRFPAMCSSNFRTMFRRLRFAFTTVRSPAVFTADVFAHRSDEFQILKPIVAPDTVDMVDDRTFGDRPVGLRPDIAMLKPLLSVDHELPVAVLPERPVPVGAFAERQRIAMPEPAGVVLFTQAARATWCRAVSDDALHVRSLPSHK